MASDMMRQVSRAARGIHSAASFSACVDACCSVLLPGAVRQDVNASSTYADLVASSALTALLASYPDHSAQLSIAQHASFFTLLLQAPAAVALACMSSHCAMLQAAPDPSELQHHGKRAEVQPVMHNALLRCLSSRVHGQGVSLGLLMEQQVRRHFLCHVLTMHMPCTCCSCACCQGTCACAGVAALQSRLPVCRTRTWESLIQSCSRWFTQTIL